MTSVQQKLALFNKNARDIARRNFTGPENKAIFWAHRLPYQNPSNRDVDDAIGINNLLCGYFIQHQNPRCYKVDSSRAIISIDNFFAKYQAEFESGHFAREQYDAAWDIFSKAFSEAAAGDHTFIAANDMEEDDFFIRIELPVIQRKFSRVTTLEPTITAGGLVDAKVTTWETGAWLEAQKEQWKKPYHFLDGADYPNQFKPLM